MKSFRKVAFISTIATYLLILTGGLVRVTGAGLGCPDWPKCFGRWIPPTSVDQLPAGMNPDLFNFALAWIEYTNRLIGVVVGILIAVTAIMAIMKLSKQAKIIYPSIIAALLVAFQGWQGGRVVASELEPLAVSLHLVIALVIASLMTYVTQQAYYLDRPLPTRETPAVKKITPWLIILWILAIAQVILGTRVREALERLALEFPQLGEGEWLSEVGAINHIHMTVGLILAIITWFVGLQLFKAGQDLSSMVRRSTAVMMLLAFLQVVFGLSFIAFGRMPAVQLFHMWTATVYIGVLLLLFSAVRRERRHA